MDKTRSRVGALVGLAATVGAFGAAVMVSGATAPTARADDFTDIINAVEGDFTAGQNAFTDAAGFFASSDLTSGLAYFFDGVNDDLLSPTDNLLVGTVEALTNEAITPSSPWTFSVPATFADGVSDAQERCHVRRGLFRHGVVGLCQR
jgi:hypothetical protein